MSVTTSWTIFNDSVVDQFHVFRAISGFVIPYPSALQPGAVLKYSVMNSSIHTVTFPINTFQGIIDAFNQAPGLVATASLDGPAQIFVRCIARTEPKMIIHRCTFATQLGIVTPAFYSARQEYVEVGTVPFVSGQTLYSFTDPNGDASDWYRLRSEFNSVLSVPSLASQPALTPPDLIAVEGNVTTIDNNPVSGAIVTAELMIPSVTVGNAGITKTKLQTVTDELGRWRLSVQRCQLVLFQIPAIGYNQTVRTPDLPAVLFQDLKPTNDHFYEPAGEPVYR